MSMAVTVSASPEYGRLQSDNTVFVGEKSAATIDFSNGVREPDGTVCVERRKSVDKTEKDQLKECFVQNVTQCYNTFITGRIKTNVFRRDQCQQAVTLFS